jgi:hypothetical protein
VRQKNLTAFKMNNNEVSPNYVTSAINKKHVTCHFIVEEALA